MTRLVHLCGAIDPTATPSAIALSGGADNAKLAAASLMQVVLPPKTYDPLSSIHSPSIAAPPAVTLQPGGTVTGVAPINVTVQANVTAAIQTVMAQAKAEISGTLTGIMSSLRSAPPTVRHPSTGKGNAPNAGRLYVRALTDDDLAKRLLVAAQARSRPQFYEP